MINCINLKLSCWAASMPRRAPRDQAPRLSDRREAEALAAHASSNLCSGCAFRAGIDRLLGAICREVGREFDLGQTAGGNEPFPKSGNGRRIAARLERVNEITARPRRGFVDRG